MRYEMSYSYKGHEISHNYKIRYDFQHETKDSGYNKEDAKGWGLTDALIFISILKNEDGSQSQLTFTLDGKEKRTLTDDEIFDAWTKMGLILFDNEKLKGWKKDCIDEFGTVIRDFYKR